MIDINLAPVGFRKKKKRGAILGGINIPPEVLVGSAGALFMLIILTYVVLLFVNMSKLTQLKKLQKEWEDILPAKENVDAVVSQMKDLRVNQQAIENITVGSEIIWSRKLNIISDGLPRGVWLRKVALNADGVLFIEGSAMSRQHEEIFNVHSFAANLKQDSAFLYRMTDLELGSIQRRKINQIDIADFLITTKVK